MAVSVNLSRNRIFRGTPSQGSNPDFPQNPFQPGNQFNGIGIKLNGLVIGGVKRLIELSDVLDIPPYWQYNIVGDLDVDGLIDNEGEINLI
jgi:hypothetical protein